VLRGEEKDGAGRVVAAAGLGAELPGTGAEGALLAAHGLHVRARTEGPLSLPGIVPEIVLASLNSRELDGIGYVREGRPDLGARVVQVNA